MSELSNCCDDVRWGETDICSGCKEHADFYDEAKNNAEWCEDHGEDRNQLNAEDDDEGYPEDDNQEAL